MITTTKYDRNILLKDIRPHIIDVRFTKLNGETRVMRCTLMEEHLPSNTNIDHLYEEHKKPENLKTVVAWDLQANGWRSFHVDNVHYVEIVDAF